MSVINANTLRTINSYKWMIIGINILLLLFVSLYIKSTTPIYQSVAVLEISLGAAEMGTEPSTVFMLEDYSEKIKNDIIESRNQINDTRLNISVKYHENTFTVFVNADSPEKADSFCNEIINIYSSNVKKKYTDDIIRAKIAYKKVLADISNNSSNNLEEQHHEICEYFAYLHKKETDLLNYPNSVIKVKEIHNASLIPISPNTKLLYSLALFFGTFGSIVFILFKYQRVK